MGPFEDAKPWSTQSLVGIRRWLDRIWRLKEHVREMTDSKTMRQIVERAVEKVSSDVDSFKFNTAISALMVASNGLAGASAFSPALFHRYLQLLAPFAPHIAEELFSSTEGHGFIHTVPWPEADQSLLESSSMNLPVQIDGKLRAMIELPVEVQESDAIAAALSNPSVQKFLDTKKVKVSRYVPGKIISIVTSNL